jgi:hypothetical protein
MIPGDRRHARMMPLQLKKNVDRAPWIRPTVDKIADEDNCPLAKVGTRLQLLKDRLQLVNLTMHIANDGDRAGDLDG